MASVFCSYDAGMSNKCASFIACTDKSSTGALIVQSCMQVSWMVLQASHLPDARVKHTLLLHLPPSALEALLDAVMESPSLPAGIQSAVTRNCCWALLAICGDAAAPANAAAASRIAPVPSGRGFHHDDGLRLHAGGHLDDEGGAAASSTAAVVTRSNVLSSSGPLGRDGRGVHGGSRHGGTEPTGRLYGRQILACGLMKRLSGPILRADYGADVSDWLSLKLVWNSGL